MCPRCWRGPSLAFRRPTLSLGLVGIMESKSALRERVERLMTLRTPRRAGLSMVSVLSILAFSAVAVPMGQGPAAVTNDTGGGLPVAASPDERLPQVLVEGKIYRVPPDKLKGLVAGLTAVPVEVRTWPVKGATAGWWAAKFEGGVRAEDGWLATPEQLAGFEGKVKAAGGDLIQRPRIQTSNGKAAQFFVGNDVALAVPGGYRGAFKGG